MKTVDLCKGYLSRFLKLWLYWCWFVGFDFVWRVLEIWKPSVSPPRWLHWAIPAVGFLVVNVKLFAEIELEKQSLQNRVNELERDSINEDSLHVSLYPIGRRGNVKYIMGNEPVKVESVRIAYSDRDGNTKDIAVNRFFVPGERQLVNASVLRLGESVDFDLPREEQVREIEITVRFVGIGTGKLVVTKKKLELGPPRPIGIW